MISHRQKVGASLKSIRPILNLLRHLQLVATIFARFRISNDILSRHLTGLSRNSMRSEEVVENTYTKGRRKFEVIKSHIESFTASAVGCRANRAISG